MLTTKFGEKQKLFRLKKCLVFEKVPDFENYSICKKCSVFGKKSSCENCSNLKSVHIM
jgi:hypothetical protein